MKFFITTLLAAFLLSGCQAVGDFLSDAQQEQEAEDIANCNSQGFETGTKAMGTCLVTISDQRDAEYRQKQSQINRF